MKFDFIIGNPPYQEEQEGDNKTFAPPIYHHFIDAAYELANAVELIHPARFLFNAGRTPEAWNEKMLDDTHLKILYYEEDASKIFPNTMIKGGIAISYHDKGKDFGAIKIFTKYDALNSILHKVNGSHSFASIEKIAVTRTAYRLTAKLHADHPEAIHQLSRGHAYDMSTNIFERLPQIFFDEKPDDGQPYIQILGRRGNQRIYRYILTDYVNAPVNLYKYKIFIPEASGSGSYGEIISSPVVSAPSVGATETFMGLGYFDREIEVLALLKYIKTKFVRALLSVLKTTQHITPIKWKYVPLQDFTSSSDIDWSKSVAEIDRQLYAKYGLSDDEINFIESHVKEMA